MKNKKIIIYKTSKGPELNIRLEKETIWLTINQISELFNVNKSSVSRHIRNIYESKELNPNLTVAKIATVQKEGKREVQRDLEYYNLNMVLSIGYRVNSKQATQFRIWATDKLKNYLLKGYTIDEKKLLNTQSKLKELQTTINFLGEKAKHQLLTGQGQEILNLLSSYSKSLTLLEQYDKQTIKTVKGTKTKFVLGYDEVSKVITKLKKELADKKEASNLFGQEYQGRLEGIIRGIYQTISKKDVYPSIEQKAAHLLYFIIKDHPFVDGNKRIGSFLFVYFLEKTNYLYKSNGERKINDNALVALALLIAISDPKDKEMMIKMISNLLQ